jgi:hypothetical protein
LTIIPMVQVWNSDEDLCISWVNSSPEHEGSKGPMPPNRRGDSLFALYAHEPVHPLGGHSISEDARAHSSVCRVSLTCPTDLPPVFILCLISGPSKN